MRALALLCLLLPTLGWGAQAASTLPDAPYVPPDLEPWVEWVLYRHENLVCPRIAGSGAPGQCAWINRLQIDVARELRFSQSVRVYSTSRVALPGDALLRPIGVTVNAKPAQVLDGAPEVLLDAGTYTIEGVLPWGRRPSHVAIPNQFGLLHLTVDGKLESNPQVTNGKLFLGKRTPPKPTEPTARDSLEVDVYRLLRDNYPLEMVTTVKLVVAGRSRVERLGQVLLSGFAVTDFRASLPARLEADGTLQVQVAAGEHNLVIAARALGDPRSLAPNPTTDNWPAQEIWGFQPDRQRRLVDLSGAVPIDLEQVAAPFAGSGVQGYLLNRDTRLELAVEQRGNPNPTPNQFTVERQLWLDFDGSGYVARDEIDAKIKQASRLAATYPLGRIDIDDVSELVNTLDGGAPGIELQAGEYRVVAVSRIDRDSDLSATGWILDANSLGIELNLPPGWRLLWATGVDESGGSWLAQWRLWDIFVLVFAGVLAWRFLSPGFGALLVVTLGLTLQAAQGLALTWLIAVGLVALARNVNHPRVAPVLRGGTWVWLVITLLASVNFAVVEARNALYPQLEAVGVSRDEAFEVSMAPTAPEAGVVLQKSRTAGFASDAQRMEEIVVTASQIKRPKYGDNMQVQTGPGTPEWKWRTSHLGWRGPVAGSQELGLALASPAWVRLGSALAAVLSLAITALLALGMWRGRAGVGGALPPALQSLARNIVPALLLGMLTVPPAEAAAVPVHPDLLRELEQRLTAPPKCFPNCASLAQVLLNANASTLTIDLLVHSGALVSVPLPHSSAWAPDTVLANDQPATLSRAGEQLLLALPAGIHRVRLRGVVAELQQIELEFPLLPAQIRTQLGDGWQANGLRDGRLERSSVGLARTLDRAASQQTDAPDAATTPGNSLQPDPVLPFVDIHRTFYFDLEWNLETTVTRVAPSTGGFSLNVALLPGEAVLDETINVIDGAARLVFGPRESRIRWSSRLAREPQLTLTAPPVDDRRVTWELYPSNLWHLDHAGLNPINNNSAGIYTGGLRFQPQADETLALTLTATTPIPGSTVTVDRVYYKVEPGSRLRSHQLQLILRATQGGTYQVTLPAPAAAGANTLTALLINDRETPVPLVDNSIALPLVPGATSYEIRWTSDQPLNTVFRAPRPQLASDANNIELDVAFPRDRWLLLLGGPTLGPAMLFWGLLAVVLLLALGIARIPGIPLTRTDLVLLALGLTLINLPATLLVAAWIVALRARRPLLEQTTSNGLRNALQTLTALLSIATLLTLITTVPGALLGSPDMQVSGNGSSAYNYLWFSDHSGTTLPGAWVVSVPMWLYRGAMLAWSLWLAFALIRWAQWAWSEWSTPRLWYREPRTESG